MRYPDSAAFRQALEARLRNAAGDGGDIARLRRVAAFDRLLVRLATAGQRADHSGWVLKGGAALEFRRPDRARSTRDVDLALAGHHDPMEQFLDDIEDDSFEDYFRFAVTRHQQLATQPDRGPVTRLHVAAELADRLFERIVVDLVPAQNSSSPTETVVLGQFFAFAELPIVPMPVIDLRLHWAEKLSAYLRRYEDRPNTRVKDLIDLVLLIEQGLEADPALYAAVCETFRQREQVLPESTLASMAEEWQEPFRQLAEPLGLAMSAQQAHAVVEEFWGRAREAGMV